MLICDALSAHAPAYAEDSHVAFAVAAHRQGAELRVSELSDQGARKLVRDAVVPGFGNVLERMTDELRIESSLEGAREELVLAMRFA